MDVETVKRFKKIRKEWKDKVKEIKSFCLHKLPDARVFVFGSVLTGSTHPLSDIDVLIVSEVFKNVKSRINFHVDLKERFGDDVFEFHLITPDKLPYFLKLARPIKEV